MKEESDLFKKILSEELEKRRMQIARLKEISRKLKPGKKLSKIAKLNREKREAIMEFREQKKEDIEIDKDLIELSKKKVSRMNNGFFGKIPDVLLNDSSYSLGAKATYAFLQNHSQRVNSFSVPVATLSLFTIERNLGVSSDITMRKYLKELLNGGWVEKMRQGVQFPNRYMVYDRSYAGVYYRMMKVQKKIQKDLPLANRLRASHRL